MSVLRTTSLQGRLLAGVAGLVAAVWAAMAVVTWFDVRHELDELLDGHLAQAAALLVAQQVGEMDEDHRIEAPSLHRYAPRVAFQVWHEGRLVLRSANAPGAWLTDPHAAEAQGFRTLRIDGTQWRVFATRGAANDTVVLVGEQTRSRADILMAVLRGVLVPAALALPVLLLVVWWAVRRGLAPLRSMDAALAARDPGALQPIELPDVPDEMRPMLDTLNALFLRIGVLIDGERRFTADAAHELRTPIAAIRTQAQVALAEADDALRRHALQATLAGCDRATRLVDQLLTLARVEAGAAPAATEVDLAAVVRRIAGEIAPGALARRLDLEVDAGATPTVRADATLLAVLVRNLVDNAVRYTPDGGRVQVRVGARDGRATLAIEDSGPGLADGEIARLGERFFRVLGNPQPGSGLGWSIVRRVAQAQGAAIAVSRSPGLGGLRVEVAWSAEH